jgi:hypothetical protein
MSLESSLFERLLADSFAELPAITRRVHDSRTTKCLRGRCDVIRGSHWAVALLSSLASLPPNGAGVPTAVTIDSDIDGETWTRQFGRHRMRTRLWKAGHLLAERLGPVSLYFSLTVREGCLEWRVVRARFLGLPIPAKWFVTSVATERVVDNRYAFEVAAEIPLIGSLIRYRGWLAE